MQGATRPVMPADLVTITGSFDRVQLLPCCEAEVYL